MTNEEVYLLNGLRFGPFFLAKLNKSSYNSGTPVHVKFDSTKVGRFLVGFYHTHPSFTADYSSTDHKTMCGWQATLGKPLVCLIDGVDRLANWVYTERIWKRNRPDERFVRRFGNWFFGVCI